MPEAMNATFPPTMLQSIISDVWAERVCARMKKEFLDKGVDFSIAQVGNSTYNLIAEPTDRYRPQADIIRQLDWWCGYHYAQVASLYSK